MKIHYNKHPDIPCVDVDRRTRQKNEENKIFQKRLVRETKKRIKDIFKL